MELAKPQTKLDSIGQTKKNEEIKKVTGGFNGNSLNI
jgi:hypothetical protein